MFFIGSAYCVASITGVTGWSGGGVVAGDAWNYWQAIGYSAEHYRYSPAFTWLMTPLTALTWEAFLAIWTVLHLIAVAWLGPWTILLAFDDVIRGNITTFLAVGVVLAVRRGHASTWAAVLLTKVTPGVGILYHAGRRDMVAVARAFGTTALIVGIGLLLAPDLWIGWVEQLKEGAGNYPTIDFLAPLPVRLAVAAVLCLLAARWVALLPVGMLLAMPGIWPSSFAILASWPRLRSPQAAPSARLEPIPVVIERVGVPVLDPAREPATSSMPVPAATPE